MHVYHKIIDLPIIIEAFLWKWKQLANYLHAICANKKVFTTLELFLHINASLDIFANLFWFFFYCNVLKVYIL